MFLLQPIYSLAQELGDVGLAVGVGVELVGSVQRSPLGLLLEEAHGLDILGKRINRLHYLKREQCPPFFSLRKILTLVSSVVNRW